jgi:hypothetical protein
MSFLDHQIEIVIEFDLLSWAFGFAVDFRELGAVVSLGPLSISALWDGGIR